MMITDASTAAQFAAAWKNKGGEVIYLTIAIEGLEAARGISESYHQTNDILNYSEAIGVLRSARLNARIRRGEMNGTASDQIK